jgi:hypothetical protein
MWKQLIIARDAIFGEQEARKAHRTLLEAIPSIRDGLAKLPKPVDKTDEEMPIFLLSAGWRSGSTWLQRLILSSNDVMVWGEPYDHCDLIPRLAESVRAFGGGWPPAAYYYVPGDKRDLSTSWTANLYPDIETLRSSHREFFMRLFAQPAYDAGFSGWGIKEVRLGGDHVAYLKWLFPNARVLFLVRDPYAAYRSYRACGRRWYLRWPNEPILTPSSFGDHWRLLTEGFLASASAGEGLFVKYESLKDRSVDLDAIEAYLGYEVDRGVLDSVVGSSRSGDFKSLWAPRIEMMLLKRAVSPVAEQLGYSF